MKETDSYQELLLKYLDGTLCSEEEAQVTDLLRSNAQARAFLRDVAEQAVTVADVARSEGSRQNALAAKQNWAGRRRHRMLAWSWVLGAAACLALVANISFYMLNTEPKIVTITGMSGALRWTGSGGRVFHDLHVGMKLSGGTVEGLTPGSWFELTFDDRSTVTLSGNATLTFADHGQKTLYLKEGSLSSKVTTQPAGKPMLVYTRSALLEVLGTQFDVEAELAVTMLNVSEGKVRLKRLSDGTTVDVKAKQRVVAADNREMQPVSMPEAVNRWKSRLHLGPEGTYGKWSAKTAVEEAKLETIPFTIPQGFTLYTAAVDVSQGDMPPVILQPGCRLRVRGQMVSSHDVYFGVNVRYLSGGFAGRFQIIRPASEFSIGEAFEILLDLQAFRLDPSLGKIADKLPGTPLHLVVEDIWCHTLDQPSGLEITEMELLPPSVSVNLVSELPQPPVMDIWAATSQGKLEVVKHHLAAGIDIDAAFIAPGIFASGATPLHMAVLSDQQELARFLIDQDANIDAPAKDEYGGTPLHWAAVLGRVEIAGQLVDAGANVNTLDKNGYTPLDATALEQFSESKTRLAVAELLRESGGESKQSKNR